MEDNVNTYKYYEGHSTQTDTIRIKKQVKGSDGAINGPTTGVEGLYSGSKSSYAGYNDSDDSKGGHSSFRSPSTTSSSNAWSVKGDGGLYGNFYVVYSGAFSVAPAFCI